MSVYLLRNYGGLTASATTAVTFPDDTEKALVAQGWANAAGVTSMPSIVGGPDAFVNQGGAIAPANQAGQGTPVSPQGPLVCPVISMGSLALTSYETNGTAPAVAGTTYYTECMVPYWNTWTGIALLNGTTVGTDNHLVVLYSSSGLLLANSAVAGAVSAVASSFQTYAFLNKITLPPGRYFLGFQANGTPSDTIRHLVTANGASNVTGSFTGTFGTILGQIATVSTTTTNAQGAIAQLYT